MDSEKTAHKQYTPSLFFFTVIWEDTEGISELEDEEKGDSIHPTTGSGPCYLSFFLKKLY